MPARPPDLRSQALDFAGRISDLLNRTVANGIRISVILQDDGQVGWAGYGITKQQPFPGRGIPLTLTAAPPRCYLHVMHTLVQRYGVLITDVSSFGLYLDEQLDRNVFHYDYTRAPANPCPPAHFQINAPSATFDELCALLGRSDWEQAVEEHRAWFHRIQLKAAVRDDPEAVREELRRLEGLEQQPKRYY